MIEVCAHHACERVSLYFLLSILSLLGAPLFEKYLRPNRKAEFFVTSFIVLSVAYIVFLHIIPEVNHVIGPVLTTAFVLIGIFIALIIEHFVHNIKSHAQDSFSHLLLLLTIVFGLGVHMVIDGVMLHVDAHGFTEHNHSSLFSENFPASLGLAIVLHRLPVALLIWRKFVACFNKKLAWYVILFLVFCNFLGFYGPNIFEIFNIYQLKSIAILQAFVSGAVLHIAFENILKIFKPSSHKHTHFGVTHEKIN